MNLALVVSGADVSFGNNHAGLVYFQHDYGMGITIYLQNISWFDIFK